MSNMEEIRENYPVELINRITDEFLSTFEGDHAGRVRAELKKIREENYDPLLLEMYFAMVKVNYEDAVSVIGRSIEADKQLEKLDSEMHGVQDARIAIAGKMISYLTCLPRERAKKGGDAKSARLRPAETETIRLYKLGTWKSASLAAAEITPQIVAFSRNGKGDLSPSTTKPLEWIRAYVRSQKSSPC
jgi:hypothetical protein